MPKEAGLSLAKFHRGGHQGGGGAKFYRGGKILQGRQKYSAKFTPLTMVGGLGEKMFLNEAVLLMKNTFFELYFGLRIKISFILAS